MDPESEKKEHTKEEIPDEDISIDFSKVKSFFKSIGKEKQSETVSEKVSETEEISIDWNNIGKFFKKYGVFFIVLIPIILSIYVRMLPANLPITDEWARSTVINAIRSQVKSGIDQQYPNLPDSNKNVLVDGELQKFIAQNKQKIDEQIKATSIYFKSFFQDENSKGYMPDIDPYYWFRYAKNIAEHGHPGDILKDGKPFDNHQLAPGGRFVTPDMFHAYFLAYFYKFLSFFAPTLSLMRSIFYYPVFVSALCVLLVFLIARRIAGNLAGFFAGLMMAINSAFLGRTLFGHGDSDSWVVFFPLFITWLFTEALYSKKVTKIVLLVTSAGFFTGVYTFAWSGWWYIFDFLIITITVDFLYLVLINFEVLKASSVKSFFSNLFSNTFLKPITNIVIIAILYFLSTALFVTLFSGWGTFLGSFLGPLGFVSIKSPVIGSTWPNVLTTVAELNEGSINGIINSVGGPFLFFIGLLGIVFSISRAGEFKKFDIFYIIGTFVFYALYFLFRKFNDIQVFGLAIWIIIPILLRILIMLYKKDISYDFSSSIILSIWVISTIFASIKGIRFTLLLAPPFSIAFGVALGNIYEFLSKFITKELKIYKPIVSSILMVLLLLPYVNPIKGSIGTASSDIPIVNDAWYNALIAIKQNSTNDAIITSWWDFGHHFKALADRGVTFDGTTQTFPAAHWVGRLLMTNNESEAIGILRMLDCGGNNAFDYLYKSNNNTYLSLKIVRDIILFNRKEAEEHLNILKFNEEDIKNILSFTHCDPPEAYFIASEDMIGKSGVWGHFGSWNFERADIWLNARKKTQEEAVEYMMEKLKYTKENAENIFFEVQSITSDSEGNSWISPWPGYAGTVGCNKKDENESVYVCSNGLQINLSNNDVFAVTQQGIVRPKSVAFTTKDGIIEKQLNGTLDFGISIIPKNENEVEAILSSKELTGGMFTRMFYMQGQGLKYFKLFNHQRGLTRADIYTYKVDWK